MQNEHLIKYKNPVLIKDQQGKVKLSVYDLPAQGHTYGKKVVDDPQPVKYLVNGWKQAQTSNKPASKVKNYQELNRQAIHNNVLTAKHQQQFRKTTDIMVQTKEGQRVMPIMLPNEQFSYGVPNRPSTPMKLVMGNCYALQAEQNNKTDYANQAQKIEANNSQKVSAKKTKSQALREEVAQKQKQYQAKANLQEPFKLNKFTSLGVTKIDSGLNASKKS